MQKKTTRKKGSLKKRPGGSIKEYILKHIEGSPDIVKFTAKHFGISPVAVQNHLRQLQAQGLVVKEGNTRGTRWLLAPRNSWREVIKLMGAQEHLHWNQLEKVLPKDLTENVRDIIRYGFTEISKERRLSLISV